MFNFFKDCQNYGDKLQSLINIIILMVILFLLNIFDIINISYIEVLLLPFIVDIIANICTITVKRNKKGGVGKSGTKE